METTRLDWLRRAALAFLWAERLAALLWAPLALLLGWAGLVLLGAGAVLGPLTPLATLLVLGAAVWWVRRLRPGFVRPTPEQAERRLETDSGLAHRPLAVLRDRPAAGEDGPLWQAHRARAAAALPRLRLDPPRAVLPALDPHAARVAALLLLASGIVVAGPAWQARLVGAMLPGIGLPSAGGTIVQAWIEPPSYTGLAPIFLARGAAPIEVPIGSKLTVSVTGGGQPTLDMPGASAAFGRLAEGAWQASAPIAASGTLAVRRHWLTLAAWKIAAIADAPPVIAWNGTPAQAGRTAETRLPWHVAQRWGVAALHAEIRPEANPDLPPLVVPIPLPGTPRDARGAALVDLESNPLAGLAVRAVLAGRSVSGQTGRSAEARFTLPAHAFQDPLAQAVAALRQRLALNPQAPDEAAGDLDALAGAPEGRARQPGTFLNLSSVAALLRDQGPAGEAEAQSRLWTLALDLDGALPSAAEQRLAQAQEDVRRAIAERAQGRITDKQLAAKIQALRQALAQRLADLARRAFERGQLGPFDPRGKNFGSPMLDRMMKRMEQSAREGHYDEARRQMAELQDLLQKLNHAKVLSPEQARRAAEANRKAHQLTGAAADLARREAGLMDHGQARAPRPPPLPMPTPVPPAMWGQDMPPPPPDPQKLEQDEASRSADAKTERALQQALRALQQSIARFGMKPPGNLGEAQKAMQQAEQALQSGQDGAARDAESEAVQDLQKGGRALAQQMQQGSQLAIMPGGGQGGDEFGLGEGEGPQQEGQRDPLGRPMQAGNTGQVQDDGSVKVPTEMEAGRSRAIQEELRRRDAERDRPQGELDYIERLLRPY